LLLPVRLLAKPVPAKRKSTDMAKASFWGTYFFMKTFSGEKEGKRLLDSNQTNCRPFRQAGKLPASLFFPPSRKSCQKILCVSCVSAGNFESRRRGRRRHIREARDYGNAELFTSLVVFDIPTLFQCPPWRVSMVFNVPPLRGLGELCVSFSHGRDKRFPSQKS
jgi:hypothetical protein